MNVNPVHQRAGNLLHVALNHRLRATAFTGTVVEKSARLRVTSLLNESSFICRLWAGDATPSPDMRYKPDTPRWSEHIGVLQKGREDWPAESVHDRPGAADCNLRLARRRRSCLQGLVLKFELECFAASECSLFPASLGLSEIENSWRN